MTGYLDALLDHARRLPTGVRPREAQPFERRVVESGTATWNRELEEPAVGGGRVRSGEHVRPGSGSPVDHAAQSHGVPSGPLDAQHGAAWPSRVGAGAAGPRVKLHTSSRDGNAARGGTEGGHDEGGRQAGTSPVAAAAYASPTVTDAVGRADLAERRAATDAQPAREQAPPERERHVRHAGRANGGISVRARGARSADDRLSGSPPPASQRARRGQDPFPATEAAPQPSVQIHIGRIEIRAVPAESPSLPPRRAPRLSLNDYLDRDPA